MKLFLIPFTVLFCLMGNAQHTTTPAAAPTPASKPTVYNVTAPNSGYANYDSMPVTEKEVSFEAPLEKGIDFLLENNNRTVEVKTWDQPKIKIVASLSYKGTASYSDEEWLDKLNVTWKKFGSSFRVITNTVDNAYYASSHVYLTGKEKPARIVYNKKRGIIVYIPAQIKAEAESRSGSISFLGKLEALKLITKNTTIEIGEVNTLTLRSQNDNIAAGNIKDAFIEMSNSHFTAKNIGNLDIDSRYSSVDAESVDKAVVRSNNDEYEIETVTNVRGIKSYGTLRIATIKKTIDLEGVNADLKIRHIAATTELIKLDNKYADIRLPAADLKNYSVSMEGSNNNVYASFDRIPTPNKDTAETVYFKQGQLPANTTRTTASAPKETKVYKTPNTSTTITTRENTVVIEDGVVITSDEAKSNAELAVADANKARASALYRNSNSRRYDKDSNFTAKTGDGSGPKFVIKCAYCSVDFK